MPKHSGLRDRIEYATVWPLLKALEWLPMPAARALSRGVAAVVRLLTPGWRSIADRNLRLAFPESDPAQRGRITAGVYRNLAAVLLSVARLPRLTPDNISEWIDYEGLEHYEEALERGRGVLFMTAHLGNWELSAYAHALFGHPMHVMVRPLDNPLLDRLLERYRTGCGNRTVRKSDAGLRVLRALRKNEAVGILIDQNTAGEDGVFVDFFGVKARATNGLAQIAMRSGATVIPGFALWEAKLGRYVLRFYPPLEMASTGNEAEDLVTNTQRCQSFLEKVIREYPDQWLWIHRRWKTRPAGEPPLY
jgi:KDO2-lipid IV(A) lauroyltransferase